MDSNLLNRQYSVLVAGDIDLSQFDLTIPVEPYVVYEYNKRSDIRKQSIGFYEALVQKTEKEPFNLTLSQIMKAKLQEIQEMTDEEFFEVATKGMIYDSTTGNALSTINPKGRYTTLSEPTDTTAIPLIGNKFQCLVQDLPSKEVDSKIIEGHAKQWENMTSASSLMKNEYLKTYNDIDTYVAVMTEPLFYNAFVSKETGWLEQGDEDQIQWVLNFRNRFIKDLPFNTKLRVYNFTK